MPFAKSIWNAVTTAIAVIAIVAAVSTTILAGVTHAATVTQALHLATTLEAGEATDDILLFTTPSGAGEGETIVVTFASEIDTSAITEDDVDMLDDDVDLTTASDCSGAEQASVAMAADVLTITICAGDGGAIAPGSDVRVEIGFVATDSGVGANQIVNPAVEGTYYVSVSGTFGDSGSFALPIGGNDTIEVSANVDQPTGSSGPGGSGCGDSTAPVISAITVSDTSEDSATITWETNEAADAAVDYGLTDSYEVGTETDTSLTGDHSIELEDLEEGTEYHFQARSSDRCGNEATSSDQTFTTLDVTACVNSNVEAVDIGETTTRISWDTNESATSTVEYGEDATYGTTVSDGTLEAEHSVILTGLSQGTTYHYRVSCEDASGNEGVSEDQTFTTEEDEAPSNVSDLVADAGDGSCTLSWSNPPDEDLAGILALRCLDEYPSGPTDDDCEEAFDDLDTGFADSGLANGTTYFYGLFAYDAAGQFASGALEDCTPSGTEEEVPEEEVAEEEVAEGEEAAEEAEETEEGETTEEGEETAAEEEAGEATEGEEAPAEEGEEEAELPETTVTEEALVPSDEVSFTVEDGAIELEADDDGSIDLIAGSELTVSIPEDALSGDVDSIMLVVGSDLYILVLEDGTYSADIVLSDTSGDSTLAILVFYADGTSQTISFLANLLEPGYTYELLEGSETRVGNSSVTLLVSENGSFEVWDASPYGQFNPVTTNADGEFAWYVENGTYQVRAEKGGYETAEVSLTVAKNIVNPRVELTAEVPIIEEIVPAVTSAVETVTETVTNTLEAIRELPGVQEAAIAAAPVVASVAVASTVALAAAFDLVPFLQYVFTSPVLLFWRRRRKAFGVVYHAYTKIPIDLAIVRLYRLTETALQRERASQAEGTPPPVIQPGDYRVVATRKGLVRTRVTGKDGRFQFLVQPGDYLVLVTKPGFLYPSQYLLKDKTDGSFLDLYHGEVIRVTDKDVNIAPNIPIDPVDVEHRLAPARIKRMKTLRVVQHVIAIVGLILALYVFAIRPSVWTFGLFASQALLYLLVRRLAAPRKPKSWGIVYDQETGRPLQHTVVRIFEPKYHKLLETGVTDSKGRYSFLLGPSVYYSTYEKSGYEQKQLEQIDFSSKKESSEWAKDVDLKAQTSQETSERSAKPPNAGS